MTTGRINQVAALLWSWARGVLGRKTSSAPPRHQQHRAHAAGRRRSPSDRSTSHKGVVNSRRGLLPGRCRTPPASSQENTPLPRFPTETIPPDHANDPGWSAETVPRHTGYSLAHPRRCDCGASQRRWESGRRCTSSHPHPRRTGRVALPYVYTSCSGTSSSSTPSGPGLQDNRSSGGRQGDSRPADRR